MAHLKNSVAVAAVLLLFVGSAFATQYMVGDNEGWNAVVDYNAWVGAKNFYVGDVLVFSYDKGDHNVVIVGAAEYDQCIWKSNYGVYDTGYDSFNLTSPGEVYFICQYHCNFPYQKLKITILPSSP